MKKVILNLRMFAGSLTLTTYYDAGYSACSASASSSLAKDDEVTYTITMASGYEYDDCEIIAGGATYNPSTKKLTMGASNAVVFFKSKADNKFMVTENVYVNVNGSELELKKNTVLTIGKNGAIIGVEAASGGQALTLATYQPAIDGLIESGVLVKL